MFLRDNRHDSDFSAFMSIWFFEEQKHSLVLMEYLRRFRPELVPTEEELHAVRFTFDEAPALETLMLHFCGEIRLNHWYRRASEWHTEPVIRAIYEIIARDEARHGGAYLQYMKRAIGKSGDLARASFAKIGVLMASAARNLTPVTLELGGKSANVIRVIRRVRMMRSEDSRLDSLESMADLDALDDLDNADPRALGSMMRKMGEEVGEDLGPEFDEVVGRLEAGEDPRFVARRIMISASEDIGMADSGVLQTCVAAAQAVPLRGMPEARITLAHATVAAATRPHEA